MLEVKNLKKVYKSKGGVVVNALDGVSISFPEKGMVFLLGKSGSGKSTLLNVIGGLDKPTSGEIIIKGKNSKDFSGADFDSYRNTFIGFIFQEYNILNEFTIEQNISLALQLQGKKNDKAAVDAILEQVDLKGYGKRKPNTLSGGQKQRIAIARALIKNPEIIMADEPTGALDSKTGKQVFDTLKKLSESKLIIVVSHDRDFAETYGDRIVELSDGKIIEDVTKKYIKAYPATGNVNLVNENAISIKDGAKLSKEDMDVIYKVLKKHSGEVVISSGDKDIHAVKQVIHINNDNTSEVFNPTTNVDVKKYDPKQTKFIRSKMPFGRVVKMGASSLKTKPIKMIFTSLLTTVSLVMFGVTSTLMLFKEDYSYAKALQNSRYVGEKVVKNIVSTYTNYTANSKDDIQPTYSYVNDSEYGSFGVEEVNNLNNNNVGLKFSGVINFGSVWQSPFEYRKLNGNDPAYTEASDYYQSSKVNGAIEKAEKAVNDNNFSVVGTLPTKYDEIAITNYQLENLNHIYDTTYTASSIHDVELTLEMRGSYMSIGETFKITGVIDTGVINADYNALKLGKQSSDLSATAYDKLKNEFPTYLDCSFHNYFFVSDDFYDEYSPMLTYNDSSIFSNRIPYGGLYLSRDNISWDIQKESTYGTFVTDDVVQKNIGRITFKTIKGEAMTYRAPNENEVYVSSSFANENLLREAYEEYFQKLDTLFSYRYYNTDLKQYIADHFADDQEFDKFRQALFSYYANKDRYYPEDRNPDEDFALAEEMIGNYFVDIATKNYVIDAAFLYRDGNSPVDKYSITGFIDFSDALSNLYDSNDDLIESQYQIVKSFIENDPEHIYRNNAIMYRLVDNCLQWDALDADENDRVYEIKDRFMSNNLVEEREFQYLRDLVEAHHYEYSDYDRYKNVEYSVPEYSGELVINSFTLNYKNYRNEKGQLNVIGTFDYNGGDTYIANDVFVNDKSYINYPYSYGETTTEYEAKSDERYGAIVSLSDFSTNAISLMRSSGKGFKYNLTDSVSGSVTFFVNTIALLKKIFFWIGLSFGVFSALMLLNFISNSISSKARDIGILRALGARGVDVFKIFFTESSIISIICAVLGIVGSAIVCWRLNVSIYENAGIYLLDFGILSVAMILGVAVVISLLGTLLPVIRAAKRPPVDSIRAL